MLDLREFDVVIQSGTHCSKYIKVNKNALIITYCHTPFRLAWQSDSYIQYVNSKGVKRTVFELTIYFLKLIDSYFSKRTSFYLTNAEEPRLRIEKFYQPKVQIEIISPPVNASLFVPNFKTKTKEYYLIVSRLEFYKKVDLVVNVFNKLGYKLIVVGKGTQEENLKEIASSNIEFRQGLSNEEITDLYANCKGFLMPQHEDYGITPLEANASGRPVIAYAKGGVLETMIPYQGDASQCTALFFNEQTEESLANAIEKFETLTFDLQFIRNHAEKFDEPIFIEKIRTFVLDKAKERGFI
jgi:glycosyltransferase involved in cell wall biosynthesis